MSGGVLDADEVIDLGGGRSLQPVTDSAGTVCGFIFRHPGCAPQKPGDPPGGWVGIQPYEKTRPSWKVDQATPLSLSPSIHCRACDDHGFVRNGQWVPA